MNDVIIKMLIVNALACLIRGLSAALTNISANCTSK